MNQDIKQIVIVLLVAAAFLTGVFAFRSMSQKKEPNFGFFYTAPTQATSSVGLYAWATILSADSSRSYVALCNNGDAGVNANNPIYLGLGATSTKPYGFRLASGECYEMDESNMFYGAIYGIASTSTTTLTSVKASY